MVRAQRCWVDTHRAVHHPMLLLLWLLLLLLMRLLEHLLRVHGLMLHLVLVHIPPIHQVRRIKCPAASALLQKLLGIKPSRTTIRELVPVRIRVPTGIVPPGLV
jgi:hypothetical protein